MTRLAVAIIAGGPSSEAEVSRASARGIEAALKASGHRAVRLELDAYLGETLRSGGFEVAFPIAHGPLGEDGALQGLLECLALPYVGSGVLASARAMDKAAAKMCFRTAGIPVAAGFEVHEGFEGREGFARVIERACREFPDGYIVKPASSGSAIGVARDESAQGGPSMEAALAEAIALGAGTALVESMLRGAEVTCGVLAAGEPARALPVIQIESPEDAFYTYEARYAPGRSVHKCPAPLDEGMTARIQELAVAAHAVLGCRDLSRVDFIVDRMQGPVVLEVNTLPGFTNTSLFPEAAAAIGLDFPALCDRLVRAALVRGPRAEFTARPLP